jgi:UDP-glucose 4-epimerase
LKILITGVAGLVGSNLARDLMKNHEVVGIDNLIGGYRDNIPAGISFIEKNVEEIDHFDLKDVEVVIHSACTPHEGLSVFSPSLVTLNTFGISMSLLSKCISSKVTKFVFLSSMARYGAQDSWPFTEDMLPKPQDPYGIAKYAFELALKNLSETHGLEYVILVPHNIIGRGQKYNDPFRNVAGIMINRMLRNKQPIIYGDGMQMRSFSDIRDVIEPLKRCIFTSSGNGQVINIGPDHNFISINSLAGKIAKILEFDLDPIYLPARPREVRMANCSAGKARLVLGYNPEITLDQTLDDMVAFVRERGPLPFDHSLPLEIISEITPLTWKDKDYFEN